MAAITPDGRNELIALYLTMFGRAPTTVQLANMVTAREKGSTLAMVATILSSESDFALISALDSDAFAGYLADALFAADTPASARDWGISWIVTQLQGTKSKPHIIAEAVQAIRATNNTNYATSKAELASDVENALQALDNKFTLSRAFEIGLEKLPLSYELTDGSLHLGVNDVAQLISKISISQAIIEKSSNSKSISLSYSYALRDELENLSKNSILLANSSSHEISNSPLILGNDIALSDFDSGELPSKLKIIREAANSDSIKVVYTIRDTLDKLSAEKYQDVVAGAAGYKISNLPTDLGVVTPEQYKVLKNAENFKDYTFIDPEVVASVNEILVGFGLTLNEAKKIILQYAENIEQIAPALKQANLTVGEMFSILASSSGVEDPPVILSENAIKEVFLNYVADYQGGDGEINIEGDSGDNILIGTDAAEVFTGGDGVDSVIYDDVSRFELTRLYEGKAGAYSGYRLRDLNKPNSVDVVGTDVEYMVFTDQKIKIPTSGTLLKATQADDTVTGTWDNDILFGAGGNDILAGGDGIDVALFAGNFMDHHLTKLYEGKNGGFSGYQISNINDKDDVTKISLDVEYVQFYDEKIELVNFLSEDSDPLSVEITPSGHHLAVGQSTILNFKFSENVQKFTVDDIRVTGGQVSSLRGLGDTYHAIFTNTGELSQAAVEIKSGSIVSAKGQTYISDGYENIDVLLDLSVKGYSDGAVMDGGDGNDVFEAKTAGTINGGNGFDQVWIDDRIDDYSIEVSDGAILLHEKDAPRDQDYSFTLNSIERVHFADRSVAFDMDGNAGIVASVLYNIIAPESVNLPLYVGVGLGQLENHDLSPAELAWLAAEFSLPRLDIMLIIKAAAENTNLESMQFIYDLAYYDIMFELARAPHENKYATSDLIGIQYLKYIPQFL